MNQNHQNHDAWEPCPPGKLAGTVQRIDRRRRTINAAIASTALLFLTAAVGLGVVGYYSAGLPQGTSDRLVCGEVQSLLPAYVAGDLEPEVRKQVEEHLAVCAHCSAEYEQLLERRSASRSGEWHNRPPIQLAVMSRSP